MLSVTQTILSNDRGRVKKIWKNVAGSGRGRMKVFIPEFLGKIEESCEELQSK
jgi:hypothetical protein